MTTAGICCASIWNGTTTEGITTGRTIPTEAITMIIDCHGLYTGAPWDGEASRLTDMDKRKICEDNTRRVFSRLEAGMAKYGK